MTAKNLHMIEKEFDEKMGYINGKTDVDLLLEEGLEDIEDDTANMQVLQVTVPGRGRG